jgi:Glu-tRNA(Gln) amidotransferase subunit E-like FAD-binding protein
MMTTSLYRHFNSNGVLLYVGVADEHHIRFRSHLKLSEWKDKIASVTIEKFDTREEATAAEIKAIQTEEPLYNSCHQRKDSRGYVLKKILRMMDHDEVEDLIDDINSTEDKEYQEECLKQLKELCAYLRIDFDTKIAPHIDSERTLVGYDPDL